MLPLPYQAKRALGARLDTARLALSSAAHVGPVRAYVIKIHLGLDNCHGTMSRTSGIRGGEEGTIYFASGIPTSAESPNNRLRDLTGSRKPRERGRLGLPFDYVRRGRGVSYIIESHVVIRAHTGQSHADRA